MKAPFFFSTIILLAAGSWSLNKPAVPENLVRNNTRKSEVAANTKSFMRCSSPTVYRGETFSLHFSAPNPPFLGVIDPAGHFFYLVYPAEYQSAGLHPLVNSEKFVSMRSVEIDPATLTADPYTYGVYQNQPVFIRPGVYTFVLGENLHVDDPSMVERVRVQYFPGKRPVTGADQAVAASN